MNQEIKIRSLTEDDLETVMGLDEITLQGIWTFAQYQRELSLPNSNFWLLCLEEKVIGMGCWRVIASNVEIPLFAIHPDYQGRGLGQYFFICLLRGMTNRNLRHARLEVKVSNQRAIKLYQKFNFQIIAKLHRYYKTTQEDGYRLMSPALKNEQFITQINTWYEQLKDNLLGQGFTICPQKSLS